MLDTKAAVEVVIKCRLLTGGRFELAVFNRISHREIEMKKVAVLALFASLSLFGCSMHGGMKSGACCSKCSSCSACSDCKGCCKQEKAKCPYAEKQSDGSASCGADAEKAM